MTALRTFKTDKPMTRFFGRVIPMSQEDENFWRLWRERRQENSNAA